MEVKPIVKNPEQYNYNKWMQLVRDELDGRSDRATIIVMATIIEAQLQTLLEAFLVDCDESKKLFKRESALSTFSSKIDMCYCLGIISTHEYKTINILRRIRNGFAHDLKVRYFDKDQSTIDLCKNLSIPFGMYVPQDLIVINGEVQPFPIDVFDKADTRERILLAFYYITNYLENRVTCLTNRKVFEASPQWVILEESINKISALLDKEVELLQKQKELLLKQPNPDNTELLLTEIDERIEQAQKGVWDSFSEDILISTIELERYYKSIIKAIKKSYGVDVE